MAERHPESGVSARRAATRARLVEAAIAVFAREGIRGATVEQICDEAGFTRGAFYSNFEGKDELIATLVQSEINQVRGHLENAVAAARASSEAQVADVIHNAVQLFVAMQPTTPELVLTLADLHLEAARSPQVREALNGGTESVKATICDLLTRELSDVGLHLRCPAMEAFAYLEATYTHYTLAEVTEGRPPNSPELAHRLTQLLTALTEPVG